MVGILFALRANYVFGVKGEVSVSAEHEISFNN